MSIIGVTMMMAEGSTTPPPPSSADDDAESNEENERAGRERTTRPPRTKRGPMPGSDAAREHARMGGESVLARRGSEHMRAIGKRGGAANKRAHADDPDYFRRIGRKGAEARHGKKHAPTKEGK